VIEIRRATSAEVEDCAALYEEVAREVFTWIDQYTITARTIIDDAREEDVYAAFDEGRLLGFSSLYRPTSFLHSLYIAKADRGRGAGSALFDHAKGLLGDGFSLKVQKRNLGAIAFYRRRGMEIVGNGDPDQPGGGWWRMSF